MVRSPLKFTHCLFPLLLSASLACAVPRDRTGLCAAVLQSGPSYQQIAELYKRSGYKVSLVDEKALAGLQFPTVSILVIPPKSCFPPSARKHLSSYLAQGGTLADLCPEALAYARRPVSPLPIADFERSSGYELTKPDGATVTRVPVPGTAAKGIQFSSRMIADGGLAVTVPLERFRSSKRDMVVFQAKGDYNIDILKLAIEDSAGSTYVSFVDLGREWRSYAVPLADFVRVTGEADPTPLDSTKAKTLTIGVSYGVVWKAAKGSLAIGPISLAGSDRFAEVMSSGVCRWRPKLTRFKAAYPGWVVDPFCDAVMLPAKAVLEAAPAQGLVSGTFSLSGRTWEIPAAPVFRGEIKAEVGEELKRIEMRRFPLLVSRAAGGRLRTVAEVRTMTGGPYKGATMILFGTETSDYSAGSPLGKALISASNYVARTPRIVRLRPSTTLRELPAKLCCSVVVANPLAEPVRGEVGVQLADGKMKASKSVVLRPHGLTEVDLNLGVVPADFPMTQFRWNASVSTSQGRDVWSDSADIRRSLLGAARYMAECQKAYRDGRFGEHFFTEIYAARTLHALGLALKDKPMIDSALRFCDMIVARQQADGGLPLGYADNTGVIYTADDGTIVIGLLQIASWLNDPARVKRYLEASRKYFGFREALYISPEKSERLQAQFGKDAPGTKAGLYGLGILKSDYIKHDRIPWPELKTEERGVPFVMVISMGAPAAMYLLEPSAEYAAVVKRDADEFLSGSYAVSRGSHFGVECLYWMRQVLTDKPTQSALDAKIGQFMPFLLGSADGALYSQARGSLRLLSLAYYRRLISDGPEARAPMLRSIWELCSDNSSYSLASVGQHFPVVSYGPSEGGFRYVAYNSIALMETLKPGSTLLGPRRP